MYESSPERQQSWALLLEGAIVAVSRPASAKGLRRLTGIGFAPGGQRERKVMDGQNSVVQDKMFVSRLGLWVKRHANC